STKYEKLALLILNDPFVHDVLLTSLLQHNIDHIQQLYNGHVYIFHNDISSLFVVQRFFHKIARLFLFLMFDNYLFLVFSFLLMTFYVSYMIIVIYFSSI